ncbi:MAG: radical SAM protein [Spirochaetes bacterium]|nr:radical SAM protein [Spirochaetota bacterium]
MRVLLIATNRNKSPFPVAPLGVLSVAAAAERAGHKVDVLDMTFIRSPHRALTRALKHSNYQAIGFGIRNLDSCSWAFQESYFDGVRKIFEDARNLTHVPLILGGSGFTISPSGWIERLKPDYAIIGEGEKAFTLLLESIEGNSTETIRGVVTPQSCNDLNSHADRPELNEIARAAHHLCRYKRYLSHGGFIGIQTKRGCPFNCIYCNYPYLEGHRLRFRDPGLVADEFEYASVTNRRSYVYITDSVFNSCREHALDVCMELIRRRSSVPWMAYCNPAEFDAELAEAMRGAGCIGIELSLDAVSDKMLQVLKKPFKQSDIHQCLQALSDAGIPTAVQLLFGGPGETIEDIDNAQHFLSSCATPNAVFASLGLRIYANTALEQIARKEGMLSRRADLFWPHYYISPGLGEDPLHHLDLVARRQWEWSTPADWPRLSMRIVQAIVHRIGTRPDWRDAGNYGKYIRR